MVCVRMTPSLQRVLRVPGHRGQLGLVSMSRAVRQPSAGEPEPDAGFAGCAVGLVRHYRLLGFRTYAGEMVPTPDGIA